MQGEFCMADPMLIYLIAYLYYISSSSYNCFTACLAPVYVVSRLLQSSGARSIFPKVNFLKEVIEQKAVKWRIDSLVKWRKILKFTSEAKQATQCSVENISAKTLCMKKCRKTMIALQDTFNTTVHFNIEPHTIVMKGTK